MPELVSRQISSAFIPGSFKAEDSCRRGASKALKCGAAVSESDDVSAFWDMLAECLAERHSVMPVHSKEEMRLLKDRFPGRIRLFVASLENEILAGTLCSLQNMSFIRSTWRRRRGAVSWALWIC